MMDLQQWARETAGRLADELMFESDEAREAWVRGTAGTLRLGSLLWEADTEDERRACVARLRARLGLFRYN